MDFYKYLQEKGITSFEAMKAHLESDEHNIYVNEDRAYPDLFVLGHYTGLVDPFGNPLNHTKKSGSGRERKATNKESPIYHCTNGLIARKSDCMPLCYSFNKMEDSVIDPETHTFTVHPKMDVENARLEFALNGTLIRVWKYKGELMVSTKRMINARRAKWVSERNFYELFMESMEKSGFDFAQIIEGYTYSFVLTHPENSTIVQYVEPVSYHIGTRNMSTMMEEDVVLENVPRVHAQPVNRANIQSFVDYLIHTPIYNIEGYVLVDRHFNRQKFEAPTFTRAKEIYGNTNSMMYRFFNLRKEVAKLNEYQTMYPHHIAEFSKYEMGFLQISRKIHEIYVRKYIKHDYDEPIPYYLKHVMNVLHADYKTNKTKTTLEKVAIILSEQDVNRVCDIYNKMIHHSASPYVKKTDDVEMTMDAAS